VAIRGVSLPEVNGMTIDDIYSHFQAEATFARRLDVVRQVGLGYLVWKQAAFTLSGGEAQRLKIAKELLKRTRARTLYILDEPTVGLHLEDVARLVAVLNQLVDAGHTVLAVEHQAHFLAACDWIIELGPAGGPAGGRIIATGPPEAVARRATPTAPFLADILPPGSRQ
jgi:excinuclease ABC subunit A